jgi:hypothetical protein
MVDHSLLFVVDEIRPRIINTNIPLQRAVYRCSVVYINDLCLLSTACTEYKDDMHLWMWAHIITWMRLGYEVTGCDDEYYFQNAG